MQKSRATRTKLRLEADVLNNLAACQNARADQLRVKARECNHWGLAQDMADAIAESRRLRVQALINHGNAAGLNWLAR